MKVYLFTYNDDMGTREDVKAMLGKIPYVSGWRYDLPHSFYIASNQSAEDIASEIRKLKEGKRFLITEVSSNRQGWLPRDTWTFLAEKEKKGQA